MNSLRDEVSTILDIRIPENKWTLYVEMLDREGKMTRKAMLSIILTICVHLEDSERKIAVLESIVYKPIEELTEEKHETSRRTEPNTKKHL